MAVHNTVWQSGVERQMWHLQRFCGNSSDEAALFLQKPNNSDLTWASISSQRLWHLIPFLQSWPELCRKMLRLKDLLASKVGKLARKTTFCLWQQGEGCKCKYIRLPRGNRAKCVILYLPQEFYKVILCLQVIPPGLFGDTSGYCGNAKCGVSYLKNTREARQMCLFTVQSNKLSITNNPFSTTSWANSRKQLRW